MIIKKLVAVSSASAVGLFLAMAPMTASAQEIYNFDWLMKMADANHDGMVTKAEFLAAMSMAFDKKMEAMKSMPDGAKMMKGDAMMPAGLQALFKDLYVGP
ncbi:MAG: EF-hand domain-containing protein [Burkholderiaceae bacterium]